MEEMGDWAIKVIGVIKAIIAPNYPNSPNYLNNPSIPPNSVSLLSRQLLSAEFQLQIFSSTVRLRWL